MLQSFRHYLFALPLAALTACGGDSDPQPYAGPVAGVTEVVSAESASVRDVDLAVPLTDETLMGGRCERSDIEGVVHLSMEWGAPGDLTRKVLGRFTRAGEPVSYTDLRGAMLNVRSMGGAEPGTIIALNFTSLSALIRNQGPEGAQALSVPILEAYHASLLGIPRSIISELWDRCA